MNALRTIGAEILGLFVEDWVFALAIAAWLAAVAASVTFGFGGATARGVILFVGLAVILLASVARAARLR